MAFNPENRFKEQKKPKTYEDFESDAKTSGLYDTFSAEDIARAKKDASYGYGILDDKKGYKAAEAAGDTEGMKFYSGRADARRQSYGGGGTVSDASKNVLAIIKQYDDSLPSDKGSKYMTVIDRLLTKIAGDKFSYDAESDPRYTLAQDYAKKAMKNQMAESALLTGGYGNSFGAAAGQQVYTDYMDAAVNDMEDRAYSKWAAERDNNYNLLGIMLDMEREEYDRAETEKRWKYQTEQDAATKAESSKAAAQDLVYSYIKMHGGIEGLTDEELKATGWSDAYISAIVEETVKERADENNTADEEILTKNDALVERYYSMGLTVPDEILANSHFAGQRALVDGYSSYYKNRLANEGTLENIEIQKAQRGLQDAGNDDAIAKNDALVEMYIAQRIMPPADLIANSSYAGHEALISGTIENNAGEGEQESETIYSDAMNYLASEGVLPAYTSMLMSPVDFNNSLKKYGSAVAEIGGRQITFYSYDEYVDAFVDEYKNKKAPTTADGVTLMTKSQFEAKRHGGSVTFNGHVFDSYDDYKRYMEEEYAYEV